MDGFVTWGVPDTPAHNCATLGEVNITSLLSVSANIRIAVLPQPCSPQHDALHSHVNPLLFKVTVIHDLGMSAVKVGRIKGG